MNIKQIRASEEHGRNLQAIFPGSANLDPLELCKKLRRVEVAANRAACAYCNGEIEPEQWDAAEEKFRARAMKILGAGGPEIFINGDPRGYTLKIDDEIMQARGYRLHRDWGGYGIIAPDFSGVR